MWDSRNRKIRKIATGTADSKSAVAGEEVAAADAGRILLEAALFRCRAASGSHGGAYLDGRDLFPLRELLVPGLSIQGFELASSGSSGGEGSGEPAEGRGGCLLGAVDGTRASGATVSGLKLLPPSSISQPRAPAPTIISTVEKPCGFDLTLGAQDGFLFSEENTQVRSPSGPKLLFSEFSVAKAGAINEGSESSGNPSSCSVLEWNLRSLGGNSAWGVGIVPGECVSECVRVCSSWVEEWLGELVCACVK